MQFQTLYDLQVSGCRYGFLPVIPALLAVGSAVACYRPNHWFAAVSAGQPLPRIASIFFGALAALAFITTWGEYWTLNRAIVAGKAAVIEGVVTNFQAAKNIKGTESFQLAGHTFSYSKYATKQGFNTLSLEGGPVANGTVARIRYVDGHIVKLEVER